MKTHLSPGINSFVESFLLRLIEKVLSHRLETKQHVCKALFFDNVLLYVIIQRPLESPVFIILFLVLGITFCVLSNI